MTPLTQLQVFNAMHASPHARLELSAHLGDGLAAALWSNRDDARDYQAPSHHTLSCYIADGTGTFRRQRPGDKGAPDKLCVMPAGQESNWVVNGAIRLAHLYVSETQFALGCVRLLDREPRELQLREATFLDDPQQAKRFRQLITLDWDEPGERLLASSLAHEIVDHALLNQVGLRQGLRLKGGLAPSLRRQMVDYIEAHLDQPITLGELALRCNLSEYHFARMFRASFGLPPHQYLLARRLHRACQLLRLGVMPLGEIALLCGFASASHFSNRFRQAVGATPGEYRTAIRG
ncbi:AraC family transcriptional regulator [Pseudomonas plecoglossicida]|jgi:AraC family transcriptional regulator|uniref:AraC family transcriptional regulator n=1 Tax=Pseudomonas shirazica TaxID=1940636 RepID=A0ABY9SN64_9PSED|nr:MULTISPECIES: AraC family transcriptional regulator [Pseudomonas]TXI07404.1 MAG: AraC family transcriptional regulator [Pseudomonas monteilii]GJB79151.1 AraC family transcriptional regulator [Aeromonas caviae]AGA75347.1 AraC family transcriptional regulator [Pseudomonas putida HB3267]MCE0756369.1 AraC family transcriptional regulator [Pseudomonas asiatica]MCE0945435.1 AraC family transcriptional regulator [Pseudomonas asiatica]